MDWQKIAFLIIGIVFGYLIRVIISKLHIRRRNNISGNRNIVVIESRNRKAKMKKGENAQYFQCIETAQWQKTKD